MNRRKFVASIAGGLSALGTYSTRTLAAQLTGRTVVPRLATRNAYRQTNLAASKTAYDAKFTFEGMVDAWGIAIRPAGAGGHFWVLGGGTSYQFVGDVTASPDPKLRTIFQDSLAEVYLPGSDAFTSADSIGKATGTAFNGAPLASDLFRVTTQLAIINNETVRFDGSARFVFVTDSGMLSAWTDRAQDGRTVRVNGPAQLMFDGANEGMSFFGVALKTDTWDTLWTVDFGLAPQIRQFDKNWQLVPTQGFVNPFAGKSVDDLPKDTPLFVARAGQDQMPGLNETLDRFLARTLACNLPITFVNHSTAPHAFDLFQDSETSREIIRRILAFLRFHLLAPVERHSP